MTPPPRPFLYRARRVILVGCLGLWITAFVITHSPRDRLPEPKLDDNQLHGVGYFVLGCAFWLTLAAHGASRRRRPSLMIGVLAVYALVDEITQPLAGRRTDVLDWVADVVGAVVAALACKGIEVLLAVLRKRKLRRGKGKNETPTERDA